MKLFESYPVLSDDAVILDRITEADIPALETLTADERVRATLPTFLYEQKYEDKHQMLARMDEECLLTGQSILLAVRPQTPERPLIGIAEIYNYEEEKQKASVGYRGLQDSWGKGVATHVLVLLRDYLLKDMGLKTVTSHVLKENTASARVMEKGGFVNKYPDLWEDWGRSEMQLTDKYVFKREWLDDPASDKLPPVRVEQFVMAYQADQDRLRAMLPEGYTSLRPVLRINAEIRDEQTVYLELNTPVESDARRGWINIANWKSTRDELSFSRNGKTTVITSPFFSLSYTGTGIEGGCPAERDNEGTFYLGEAREFRPAEKITDNKEFCDCEFAWHFHPDDARGKSTGKTLPAYASPVIKEYPACALTAENAAAIPCLRVLGSYIVRFIRRKPHL